MSERLSFPEAADYLDRIADARSNYASTEVAHEVGVLKWGAAALRGDNDALVGLLPSWLWEQFGLTSFAQWQQEKPESTNQVAS